MIPFTKLHSTDRQELVNILPLEKPFTLLIEPSSLCNFKCVQCFQSLKTESYFSKHRKNMSFDVFLNVIEQLKSWNEIKLKVLKLSLYGEPLINSDFCEMLRIVKDANIAERVETTSNASLLNKNIAENLIKYQLDYLRVSIYSPNQEKHERITGSKIDIRKVYENLKFLQSIKKKVGSERPFVAIKMLDTYSAENDDFFEMYKDIADEIYLDKPHNWVESDEKKFTDELYGDASGIAEGDVCSISQKRIACPMGFTTMAVRSNGDVSPCCVDFVGGTNLGNVNDKSLKELWHSREWYEFLKMQLEDRKHENPSCARCSFYMNGHYIKDTIDDLDVSKLDWIFSGT